MPRHALVHVAVGGRSHGCKSMPDSVNVSETQPSMMVHTTVIQHSSQDCGKSISYIVHSLYFFFFKQLHLAKI